MTQGSKSVPIEINFECPAGWLIGRHDSASPGVSIKKDRQTNQCQTIDGEKMGRTKQDGQEMRKE